ncbi:MAG TPA: sugar ABC transporter permease [Lachnospiraceae bacterium]|nr:sugar ABC transporter permease [Lachnospiraceae bacterium]HCA70578.1 sugar ABC transporter permease [Lachnospiraceae bacterium]
MAKKLKPYIAALGFILPFFVLYTIFTIWPVIKGVYVSFHKWSLMGKQKFIGVDNYTKLFTDKNFVGALKNTFTFVIITAPLLVIVALILALLANRPTKLKKFLRTCYYLPCVLSVSVASFIARYLFAPYRGFINGVLHGLGLMAPEVELQWLQDSNLVWATISSMTVWWTVGFSMMLYISALQDISPQILEAASIDGASKAQQLFHVTLPLLKPTTWLVILLQVIACFKVFGQIYLITGGGPASSTRPLIQYIYETAFNKSNMGYAAAMSYVLFFILVVLSLLQQYIQRKGEREE